MSAYLNRLKAFFHSRRLKSVFLLIAAVILISLVVRWGVAPSASIAAKRAGLPVFSFDVAVYGGTPSGIMAAVEASRQGLRVALINPDAHLGGVVSGGLCSSDVGNVKVIGGLAREFFTKAGAYYRAPGPVWSFEPHVAEDIFNEMVQSAGVYVFNNYRLKEAGGVEKSGAKIVSLTTADGSVFSAKIFIDSSYEGDLMAAAGVSYTVGRESRAKYGERLAGVRPFDVSHNFRYDISPLDGDGRLLQGISEETLPGVGSGDDKVPAYNYRLCLTNVAADMLPFTKPENYDPADYELLLRWLITLKQAEGGRPLRISDVFSLGGLPNHKYDANNLGPVSSDDIGESQAYPDAGPAQRTAIADRHKTYLQGLLYFLTTDERVPSELREAMGEWGLAKDEFTDNGGWPYQLYIREGRRMTGEYVLTQQDLLVDPEKRDTVGMGSYPIDSHYIQRIVAAGGVVKNEGQVFQSVRPYQIPYRSIVPKASEARNLLVTVCVSASHVAYSSLRMEPQYMILGQAAGDAAKLAIEHSKPVQKISVPALQSLLKAQGAVLSLN